MATPAGSLVSIPDCSAHHLLGSEQIHLISNAELQLVEVHGSSTTPPLTLTLGESLAFPLNEHVVIGTQTGNGQIYLLRPHMDELAGPQGWIRIELPEGVEDASSELGKLRDQWEEILVKHGFLFGSATRAGGDEIANGIKEGAQEAKDRISETADRYKSGHAPTDAPASFSRNTHARAGQASSITSTAASYAQRATEIIGGLSHTVGTAVARSVGIGEVPEDSKTDARRTAEDAGRAAADVATGLGSVAGSVGQTAGAEAKGVIAYDKGDEAAELSGKVGSTAANVAAVGGSALLTTSAAFHGTEAARGVAEVDLNPQSQEVREANDLQQA